MKCHFNSGLCGFTQSNNGEDSLDWIWHDGIGKDDPFLPQESHKKLHYIYLNTSADEVKYYIKLHTK